MTVHGHRCMAGREQCWALYLGEASAVWAPPLSCMAFQSSLFPASQMLAE
jgi:hypothetical protein